MTTGSDSVASGVSKPRRQRKRRRPPLVTRTRPNQQLLTRIWKKQMLCSTGCCRTQRFVESKKSKLLYRIQTPTKISTTKLSCEVTNNRRESKVGYQAVECKGLLRVSKMQMVILSKTAIQKEMAMAPEVLHSPSKPIH